MDTDKFVLDQNISHYREQLKSETNAARREVLAKLLADANAELARLLHTTAAGDSRAIITPLDAARGASAR